MSEESARMMVLLQELVLLKESNGQASSDARTLRKRRREIHCHHR
jgi:hypothetical protein